MNNLTDQPIQVDLFQKGYDAFGQNPLVFSGSQLNAKTQTMFEGEVPSNFIQDGDIIRRLNLIDGWLQSNNFVTGVSGWRIDSDGNVEFASGTFRGTLSAASGSLGAITIGTNALHIDSSGNMWWGDYATYNAAVAKISGAAGVIRVDGLDVIDNTGLHSENNFPIGGVGANESPALTTSSTSWVDITGSTSPSIVLDRATVFSFTLGAVCNNNDFYDNGSVVELQILDSIDGAVTYLYWGGVPITLGINYPTYTTITSYATLSAGTHSLKMQWKVSNDSGALYYWAYDYGQYGK